MIADMGTENDDEEDSRETYAELRRKYDVDNEGWEHGDQQEPSLVVRLCIRPEKLITGHCTSKGSYTSRRYEV